MGFYLQDDTPDTLTDAPASVSQKPLYPASRTATSGYRILDPKTGRWLARETLGELESENLYAMTSNDAVNYFDFLGLQQKKGNQQNQITPDWGSENLKLYKSIPRTVPEIGGRLLAPNETIYADPRLPSGARNVDGTSSSRAEFMRLKQGTPQAQSTGVRQGSGNFEVGASGGKAASVADGLSIAAGNIATASLYAHIQYGKEKCKKENAKLKYGFGCRCCEIAIYKVLGNVVTYQFGGVAVRNQNCGDYVDSLSQPAIKSSPWDNFPEDATIIRGTDVFGEIEYTSSKIKRFSTLYYHVDF